MDPIIISEGTLRTQDLIPKFLAEIEHRAPAHYEGIIITPFPTPPAHAQENEDDPWWDSEHCLEFIMELTTILEEHAPEGFYFGPHPDDGACFGFWPIEED